MTHGEPPVSEQYTEEAARRHPAPMLVLALLLTGGIALRLAGITRQDLWLDEAFSTYVAAHQFPQILTFITGSDAHPPLYYLVLHVWMLLGQSVLILRLLSVLASVGSVLLTYDLGRRLASQTAALVAASLMSVSAFQVWYGQEVRMYAWTTLAVLAAACALVRAWQDGGPAYWLAYSAAVLAALYLDYTAAYTCVALVAWGLLACRERRELRLPFAVSSLLIVLGYLPWLPSLWHQLANTSGLINWISGAPGTGFVNVITNLLINRANLMQSDAGTLAIVEDALSLAVLAIALWVPRREPAYPLLAVWLCWPFVAGIVAGALAHPILIDRSVMVVQPALFLLMAMSAERAWQRYGGIAAWLPRLAVVVILGTFGVMNVHAQSLVWTTTVKENWSSAAALVAGNAQSNDLVLFNAYFTEMPFDYYFNQDLTHPGTVVEAGFQLEESLLFANLAPPGPGIQSGSQLSLYPRVWVILSHAVPSTALNQWLTTHTTLVHQWQYVGITVQLYQRSSP